MKRYNGKSMHKGIAIGKISIFKKAVYDTALHPINDVEAEIERYNKARDTAVQQLQESFRKP